MCWACRCDRCHECGIIFKFCIIFVMHCTLIASVGGEFRLQNVSLIRAKSPSPLNSIDWLFRRLLLQVSSTEKQERSKKMIKWHNLQRNAVTEQVTGKTGPSQTIKQEFSFCRRKWLPCCGAGSEIWYGCRRKTLPHDSRIKVFGGVKGLRYV